MGCLKFDVSHRDCDRGVIFLFGIWFGLLVVERFGLGAYPELGRHHPPGGREKIRRRFRDHLDTGIGDLMEFLPGYGG